MLETRKFSFKQVPPGENLRILAVSRGNKILLARHIDLLSSSQTGMTVGSSSTAIAYLVRKSNHQKSEAQIQLSFKNGVLDISSLLAAIEQWLSGTALGNQNDILNVLDQLVSSTEVQQLIDKAGSDSSSTENPVDQTEFTMTQTLSDEAQQMTISFNCLAFLSGSLGADSFFPPGKVADFWGFQFLRDNDPSKMGHNTDFLTRASNVMLQVLSEDQRNQLVELASSQVSAINDYGYRRFVLMKVFRRLLEGGTPSGKPYLSRSAVKAFSAELYELDGLISLARAKVMGAILKSLSSSQKAVLDPLKGTGMLTWPKYADPDFLKSLPHDKNVAVRTYAGDLFSWYTGSLVADVYFCPERQGTYFGSFYLKDAPAIGNPDYTIDSNLTANGGKAFMGVLTQDQAKSISGLVTIQKSDLQGIVQCREQISAELRKGIAGQTIDETLVADKMKLYGEYDGDLVYNHAKNFASVGRSLTNEQKEAVKKLRSDIGVGVPVGAYLYSTEISMPEVPETDSFFSADGS